MATPLLILRGSSCPPSQIETGGPIWPGRPAGYGFTGRPSYRAASPRRKSYLSCRPACEARTHFEAFRIANMAQAISKKPAAVVIRRAQPCTGGAHDLKGFFPTACEQHLCLTRRLMEADYFVSGVSAAGPHGVTGGCVGTSKDSRKSEFYPHTLAVLEYTSVVSWS